MKIDLYNQRYQQRCNALNVLSNIMFVALICRRFFLGLYTRTAVARLP